MSCLGTERALSQAGIDTEVEIGSCYIGLVIIERVLLRSIAEQFETVFSVIPIQGGGEVQFALSLRLDGSEGFQGMLELVVVCGAVESAGAEVLVADASLPAKVPPSEVMAAVPECLEGSEIAVQAAGGIAAEAVAALIAGRNAVEAAPVHHAYGSGRAQGTE